jgi:uncharacterized membrane protein YkvA (DUF1232 family)
VGHRPYTGAVATALRSPFFGRALERAARLITTDRRLVRLAAAAGAALQRRGRALGAVRSDAQALVRMVRESAAGRYRRLPVRSLLAVVAAIVYFLDPLDLIPDFIPVLGFADDAAVLLWVAHRVRRDLDAFLACESGRGAVIDVEPAASPLHGRALTPRATPHS